MDRSTPKLLRLRVPVEPCSRAPWRQNEMTDTIGVVGCCVILGFSGIARSGHEVINSRQDDGRARDFVAAAKRGDENAVRKALDEDSTLTQALTFRE